MLEVIYQSKGSFQQYRFMIFKDEFSTYKTIEKLSNDWDHKRFYLTMELKWEKNF